MVEDRVDRGPRRGRCVRSRRTLRPLAQGCAERPDPPGRASGARRRWPTGARSSLSRLWRSRASPRRTTVSGCSTWTAGSPASALSSWTGARSRRSSSRPSARSTRSCTPGTIGSRTRSRRSWSRARGGSPCDEEASPRRTALDHLDAPRPVGARGSAHIRDIEGRDAHPHEPDRVPRCARRRPGPHAA